MPVRNLEEYMDADDMAAMIAPRSQWQQLPQPSFRGLPARAFASSQNWWEKTGQLCEVGVKTEEKMGDNEQLGPQAPDVSKPNVHAETMSTSDTTPLTTRSADYH